MTPGQAVLVDMFEIYEARRDDVVKWLNMPYWLARAGHEGSGSAGRYFQQEPRAARRWAKRLRPFGFVRMASGTVGLGWATAAALRCVEAIRLYAATHEGNLPPSLDAIHEVPIPISPVTGKPFGYCLEGDVAVLDAGGLPRASQPRHYQYRVRVVKKRWPESSMGRRYLNSQARLGDHEFGSNYREFSYMCAASGDTLQESGQATGGSGVAPDHDHA